MFSSAELSFLPEELALAARSYEDEPYWGVEHAGAVIDAISDAGMAVAGLEQWKFEPPRTGPRVILVTTYDLRKGVPWAEVVEDARRKAHEELRFMSDPTTVLQITWLDRSEVR